MEKEVFEHHLNANRRHFLGKMALGVGGVALGSLLMPDLLSGKKVADDQLPLGLKHFAAKAKRIILLVQNGAPSQLESFDYKPKLNDLFGQDLPPSVRGDQKLTGMNAGQKPFLLVGSKFGFKQYGKLRTWISELLPNPDKIPVGYCG